MAREKKPVHKVIMTEGKRSIIQQLFQEYDIQSAEDIQEALKDLLGGTIKEMMETEMDEHLGYQKSQRSDSEDYRNGYKRKRVNSRYGTVDIQVPQDRNSTFEPQVVRKRQKDISSIDQKIISMYAKGMTTRQISETLEDIYGFEASEGFISDVTDKILPQIEDWQKRPLSEVYPVLYIDAIHYSVRDNGVIRKLAAYVILGINIDGQKEVLTIQVGDNESAKYWLSVLNELKNRGVKDILILCGISGKGNQNMVCKISEFHEKLEAKLGCHLPNFQVFHERKKSDLHDQCHRIPEFHLPEAEPSEKRISKRYSAFKSPVSGDV